MPLFSGNFDKVLLLAPFQDSKRGTLNADFSKYNRLLVTDGTQDSKIITLGGKPCLYLDGNADYLYFNGNQDDFDLIGSDFTIEAEVHPTSLTNGKRLVSTGGGAVGWSSTTGIHFLTMINSVGQINFQYWNGTAVGSFVTTGTLPLGVWTHVSFNLTSTNLYMAINGVVETFTLAASPVRPSAPPKFYIGTVSGEGGATTSFTGGIRNLLVTKGVALRNANFTPPTTLLKTISGTVYDEYGLASARKVRAIPRDSSAPAFTTSSELGDPYYDNVVLRLPCNGTNNSKLPIDSAQGKSAISSATAYLSTAQSKFDGSSLYFTGTNGLITYGQSWDWYLGDTFTFEWWMYPTAAPGAGNYCRIFTIGINGATNCFTIQFSSTLLIDARVPGTNNIATGSGALTLNTWQHVVVQVHRGVSYIYVNGTLLALGNLTVQTMVQTNGMVIGYDTVATVNFQYAGYLDDIRITKGIARYPATFTAPTATFGVGSLSDAYWSNVSFLMRPSGANNTTVFTDESSYGQTITTVGSAVNSTTQFKFSPSSLYTPADGSYLTVTPSGTALNMSTGDFTIEMWVYTQKQTVAKPSLIGTNLSTWQDSCVVIMWDRTDGPQKFSIYWNVGGTLFSVISANTWEYNKWTHFAVSRKGTLLCIWVNGYLDAAGTCSANIDLGSGGLLNIGRNTWDGATSPYTGYIDDLRITKGVCRYFPSNFTVPTATLPVTKGSEILGTYSIEVPDTECDVIALDDAAGNVNNDLIARVIPG